jgi:hypothetical protein
MVLSLKTTHSNKITIDDVTTAITLKTAVTGGLYPKIIL